MTKETIMAHIKEANTNKEIKWYVAENTADKIVLKNDYGNDFDFTIKISEDNITVRNCSTFAPNGDAVAYLFKGEHHWEDYTDDETGIALAIKAAVRYFNHVY